MPRDGSNPSATADAFVLDGCVGWLHSPPTGGALAHGVVLCNPLGSACVATHRNWRHFACLLAQAGIPTLRFDYPGTGDSADLQEGGQVVAWIASIGTAMAWLREHTGVTQITLCGLRFGALLAAEAAAANPGLVHGLALLAAPPSGRAYLRELQIGAATRNLPTQGDTALEAEGLWLAAPDVAAMRMLNLPNALRAACPARVIVLQPAWQGAVDPALDRAVRDAGASFTQLGFPGFRDFMKPAYKSLPPEDSFQDIIAWLRPQDCAPLADAWPPALTARNILPGGVEEEAFRCGDDGGVFGIACLPAYPAVGAPAALIVNTGAEPHTGHSRASVLLARRLAALGVASFRIDVTGFGDSSRPALPVLPPGVDQADYSEEQLSWLRVFHPEFVDDMAVAAAELERRGFARHIVIGNCSGANLALYAAQRDLRVLGVVLINPNMSVRGTIPFEPENKMIRVPRHPVRAALRQRLNNAGLDEDWRNRIRTWWRVSREDAACWLTRLVGTPVLLKAKTRGFWILRQRRISMLTIFSAGDNGLPDWRLHAASLWPHTGGAARGAPLFIGDNHTFEHIAVRDELVDAICAHIDLTYLAGAVPDAVSGQLGSAAEHKVLLPAGGMVPT